MIETAREQVAELISASAREIIFTSCATESNNAASGVENTMRKTEAAIAAVRRAVGALRG